MIQAQDGIKGLYRGLGANLAGACFSWGLYFLWYDTIKTKMQNRIDTRDSSTMSTSTSNKNNTSRLPASHHLLASAAAGALTSLVTNPFWLIKTRMCAERASDPGAYRGLMDGLRKTYQGEGVRGLYKGIAMSLVGVSHGAVQFVAYEEMKRWWSKGGERSMNSGEIAVMSVSSKIVAMVVTYPYQVVRARIQNQRADNDGRYRTSLETIGRIYRGEGLLGFYKGCGPALIRVIPGTILTFVVYEGTLKLIQS
ncbi:mitochondrial carrier domain-containing protein [Chytriomyces sp. MP71]|nr:mitochondrial carrier domain-containing protein [Chytriomyces sp. MP71]